MPTDRERIVANVAEETPSVKVVHEEPESIEY